MRVQVIGSPQWSLHVLLILLTALQSAWLSPLIPSAPLAARAPPIFLLPEKQPPWQPAVILETHMEKSSWLLCLILQADLEYHSNWHAPPVTQLPGGQRVHMHAGRVCVFLCVAEWDHGNIWGPGSIWIFYYSLRTQRRKESSGLEKNPKQQTINRNCINFLQVLCFRTPTLSHFLTFVSPE